MRNKRVKTAVLIVGILLMVAYVVVSILFALPLSNDPNRAMIGNGNFWFAYYFAQMAWLGAAGIVAIITSILMALIPKK